jgi:hypothetical protein
MVASMIDAAERPCQGAVREPAGARVTADRAGTSTDEVRMTSVRERHEGPPGTAHPPSAPSSHGIHPRPMPIVRKS